MRVFIAGAHGMVGSALCRALHGHADLLVPSRSQLDLLDERAVRAFFRQEHPDTVILAAARVGGIQANIDHPAEFLYENLVIQNNVIQQSYLSGVKRFCFLGSSCVYPRECPQPMKEEYLLSGRLEPTNEGYAVAKIVGLKLVEYYRQQYGFPGISVIPCNLYGTNDHFDPVNAHVLSALVAKFVGAVERSAQTIMLWGTGQARREFMHVDDAAAAVLFMLEHYDGSEPVNIGWGKDITIRELAEKVAQTVGFGGRIRWDHSKPDGMPRKCLDVTRMRALGFNPTIDLTQGIQQTVAEYRQLRGSPR